MGTVQFSPFTSIFENGSAGTVLVGSPGSGKTYFLLNVLTNCVLMKQRIFGIDPKNDLGVLSEIFPDEVEYIDINDIKSGALNPFTVLRDFNTITLNKNNATVIGKMLFSVDTNSLTISFIKLSPLFCYVTFIITY